jgi:hypothetical protein
MAAMAVVVAIIMLTVRDSGVENTQDAQDVKADFWPKPRSRNTIVGLSLLGLSPIFKGQHWIKKDDRTARDDRKKASVQRAVHEQHTKVLPNSADKCW